MFSRILAFSLALVLFSFPALPLADDDTHYQDGVEEKIVTTSRTGEEDNSASVTIITREEIERSKASSLGELLKRVAGLSVVTQGTVGRFTSVFTRGANSNQTLFLIDGVPFANPMGPFDFSHIALDNVERIEVLRGNGSPLWGTNAGGGVVNLITRKGKKGLSVSLRAGGGNHGLRRAGAELEAGTERIRNSLGFSFQKTDNHFPHDTYKNATATGRFFAELPWRTTLTLTNHLERAFNELGPGSAPLHPITFASDPEALDTNFDQHDRRRFHALRLSTHSEGGRWKQNLILSYGEHEVRSGDKNEDGDPLPYDTLSQSGSVVRRIELSETFLFNDTFSAVLGGEYTSNTGGGETETEPTALYYDGSFSARSIGRAVFAETRMHDGPTSLSLSMRYDEISASANSSTALMPQKRSFHTPANAFTWRAGLSQHFPSSGGTFHVSGGSSFHMPDWSQLYFPGFESPDLKPERGRSIEAGYRQPFWKEKASVGFTAYRNSFTDMIAFDLASYTTKNIAESHARGVEIEARVRPVSSGVFKTLELGLDYHYLETEDHGTGMELLRRPHNTLVMRAAWQGWDGRLTLGGDTTWRSSRMDFASPGFDPDLPQVKLYNFYGDVEIRNGLSAELRVDNVSNKGYGPGYPKASRDREDTGYTEVLGFPPLGRQWYFGLKWDWQKKR